MSKVAIVYWSGTGNTTEMANCVEQGAKNAGAETAFYTSADFNADMVAEFDAIAFGCPSMGAEELEETEFEPMWAAVKGSLAGKKIALFGSYGWGDGEWMRIWEDECAGLDLTGSYICNEMPDDDAQKTCAELGASLA